MDNTQIDSKKSPKHESPVLKPVKVEKTTPKKETHDDKSGLKKRTPHKKEEQEKSAVKAEDNKGKGKGKDLSAKVKQEPDGAKADPKAAEAAKAAEVAEAKKSRPSTYYISSWLFLRIMGALYVIAFVSVWVQIHGLIGEEGISPMEQYFTMLDTGLYSGQSSFFEFPSVFWISRADWMIHLVCALGTLSSLLLTLDILPGLTTFVSWFMYLSIVVAGQTFFNYQWDHLLLETGFLMLFFSSFHTNLKPFSFNPRDFHPPIAINWLFRLLLFRLHFGRGIQALLGKDKTWRTLSAFNYYFETQPSPTSGAWFAHQLPEWFHQGLVFWVLTIEVGIVFLIIGPKLFRRTAALYLMVLQFFYIATGNFGTWHWNVIALCVLLLDDDLFPSLLALLNRVRKRKLERAKLLQRRALSAQLGTTPASTQTPQGTPATANIKIESDGKTQQTSDGKASEGSSSSSSSSSSVTPAGASANATQGKVPPARLRRFAAESSQPRLWHRRVTILVAVFVIVLTTIPLSAITRGTINAPAPLVEIYRLVYPFKVVNLYGPFHRVAKERYELVIQASADAQYWYPYVSHYKPTQDFLWTAPPFVSPHISRLEYALVAAAQSEYNQEIWISRLLHRLLEDVPYVTNLFQQDALNGTVPEYIRAVRYDFRFTSIDESRANEGAWWKQEFYDIFTPSFSQTVHSMSTRRKNLRKRSNANRS